ncbi:MAG TPA: PIG-L deacetylase family protein [Mycobacteriales bacterium]|nr:PIG-L deacetylase family protein [Mycobacteriales bacterium]
MSGLGRRRRVLAVGAHPDDVEIGCGATLLRNAAAGHRVTLLVLTAGQRGRAADARVAEQERAAELLRAEVVWGGFADGELRADGVTVAVVERVLARTRPHVVYTHAPDDTHQDHVAAARATLAAARWHPSVLHYHGPTTLRFSPSVFTDVEGWLDAKERLVRCHAGQVAASRAVDLDAVRLAAAYWGGQARLGQAEAFETARLCWDPTAGAGPGPLDTRTDLPLAPRVTAAHGLPLVRCTGSAHQSGTSTGT